MPKCYFPFIFRSSISLCASISPLSWHPQYSIEPYHLRKSSSQASNTRPLHMREEHPQERLAISWKRNCPPHIAWKHQPKEAILGNLEQLKRRLRTLFDESNAFCSFILDGPLRTPREIDIRSNLPLTLQTLKNLIWILVRWFWAREAANIENVDWPKGIYCPCQFLD